MANFQGKTFKDKRSEVNIPNATTAASIIVNNRSIKQIGV